MSDRREYWWVSVGGNPCEPAAIDFVGSNRFAYTAGCADAFDLQAEDCPVELVLNMPNPPDSPVEKARKQAEYEEYLRKNPHARRHGWRPPLATHL